MNYRKLGRSGLRVSEVSLGGWLTQGRSIDDSTTASIVNKAFDLGINLFDTADAYNGGEAEKSLAKAIKGFRRDDLVLATKCFFPMSDRPNDRGLSRKHLFESVHHSLERLETEYIDLMQFHRFDIETPVEETVQAIGDLIKQGKVLYWGVSEWPAQQIANAVHLSRQYNVTPPISNQPQYNMLNPKIDDAVIPTSEQLGVGQIVFSPLAQGVLTGKYLPGQAAAEGTRGADNTSNNFMQDLLKEETLTKVQKLKAYAEGKGLAVAEFALAWCLRQPNVASVIIGASKPEQVEQNVKAADIKLSPEEWNEAEAILAS